jgi:hypothetical protein
MNTCFDSRSSTTYRDPTGEVVSVVATKGQRLNRAKSESALRGIPSRGRGSKERGLLTPKTVKKIGIFQAISNAIKGKKNGGDKGRVSHSSKPALFPPIPNLEEEDDILAEEPHNYFGTDPMSSFSSIGASSSGDIIDFQPPAVDPRRNTSRSSKSVPTITTPSRGIRRHHISFLRRKNVEEDTKSIGIASSYSQGPFEKAQNGWESPLARTPTRAFTPYSGAYYGGLTTNSPLATRPPLPRPPLAGPPLHSGITGPICFQNGEVDVTQGSSSSVPKSKVPSRVPCGNVASVRGWEQAPLSPARNMNQSYSPPPRDSPPAIPLAPPNQNEYFGPPSNYQPVRGSTLPSSPLAGLPLHYGITSPMGVQKGEVDVTQTSSSSVPKSKVPSRVPCGNVASVRGWEQAPLSPARNMNQSYSPPPRDVPPAIPLAPPNQNEYFDPPSNYQPVHGSTPPRSSLAELPLHYGITSPMGAQKGKVDARQRSPSSSVPKSKVPRVPSGNVASVRDWEEQAPLSMNQSYSPPPRDSPSAISFAPPNQNEYFGPPSNYQPVHGSRDSSLGARPGVRSVPLAHDPASAISDRERTRSRIVPLRSDSDRNFSGCSLTIAPTKPGASHSSASPKISVEGSLEDMKRSIQRPSSAHMSFRSRNTTLSREDKKPGPAVVSQIEIAPGIFKPLRGSEETWKAIQTGNIVPTACISCSLSLHCLDDAEYVVCPACRVVGPVECCLQGFGWGIGLGVKDEQLAIWRAEIQSFPA